MRRAGRRTLLLLLGLVAGATFVLANGDGGYLTGPSTVDKGGDWIALGEYRLLGTVGDTAVGPGSNVDYRLNAGLIPALDFDGYWLRGVRLPDPAVIGTTGTSFFDWVAERDGNFEILLDGQPLDTGNCSSDTVVTSRILGTELPEDEWSEVVLKAVSGGEERGLSYRVFHDATPPEIRGLALTQVVGRVNLDRAFEDVTELDAVIPGQPDAVVPVAGDGSFVHNLPAGAAVVHYNLVNRLGRNTRRTVDLTGQVPPPPEDSSLGRTIFWTSKEGEVEIEYEIKTHDEKGRLFGTAVLRLANDPNTYPLGQVKGKLKFNKRKQYYKFKLKMKSLKGEEPKSSVKLGKAVYVVGVVHAGKVKVKVKGVTNAKYFDVTFRPLQDNGSPVEIDVVRIEGRAEDAREPSRVKVTTFDDEFEGLSPVPFTDTLPADSNFADVLLAEDDAEPPNQATRVVRAVVGRIE